MAPANVLAETYFYPRPPRGGRLPFPAGCSGGEKISIHALREEGDQFLQLLEVDILRFLSTPSARRATLCYLMDGRWTDISIHALREEGDCGTKRADAPFQKFLSTPSARRATTENQPFCPKKLFLSTPSARRATPQETPSASNRLISIHALREEGDSKNRDKISIFKQIIQHSARI